MAWKAKHVAAGTFLVNFPTVARINEAAVYDWVPLRQVNVMVNIKLWSDESLAAGKMTMVWCRGILMTVAIGMAYRRGSSENSDGFGSRLGK
jgi:hypothetical protein